MKNMMFKHIIALLLFYVFNETIFAQTTLFYPKTCINPVKSTCSIPDWCQAALAHPCSGPFEPPVQLGLPQSCLPGTIFIFPSSYYEPPIPNIYYDCLALGNPVTPGIHIQPWCCQKCPPGYIADSSKLYCWSCPPGSVTKDNVICEKCGQCQITNGDQTNCIQDPNCKLECPPGSITKDNVTCEKCGTCQITNLDQTNCIQDPNCNPPPPPPGCPPGTAPFNADGTECIPPPNNKCPAGTKLSGQEWAKAFDTETNIEDLLDPFKTSAKEFKAAVLSANPPMIVKTISVYRRPQRSYMLNHTYGIWKENENPEDVLAYIDHTDIIASLPEEVGKYEKVNICWIHTNSQGNIDIAKSKTKAKEQLISMGVTISGPNALTTRPAFPSNHNYRVAIDMNVTWSSDSTVIKLKNGTNFTIKIIPKNSMNKDLWKIANSYGVKHYGEYAGGIPSKDVNHWSNDGH
jgi:hypothetical protein